jgi:hypothetical protein
MYIMKSGTQMRRRKKERGVAIQIRKVRRSLGIKPSS